MADLVVTFCKERSLVAHASKEKGFPVAEGSSARSEAVAVGATSVVCGLSAVAGEHFVVLKARAGCWVAIGANPTAEALDGSASPTETGDSWYLDAGDRVEFAISPGDKVAVIQA